MFFTLFWDAGAIARYATVDAAGLLVQSNDPDVRASRNAAGRYCVQVPTVVPLFAVASAQNRGTPGAYAVGVDADGCTPLGMEVTFSRSTSAPFKPGDHRFSIMWLGSDGGLHSLAVRGDGSIRSSDVEGVTVRRIRAGHYCIGTPGGTQAAVGVLQAETADGEETGSIYVTTLFGNECSSTGNWDIAVETGGW